MFNRLIKSLPFNPSLLSQVSFYAKRLKQENSVRRLGFLFIALTFFVQMFAVIAPPQPSLAADRNNDVIPGGVNSKSEVINHCRNNNYNFSTILKNGLGITCADLERGNVRRIDYGEHNGQLNSMGRLPYGKPGEYSVNISGAGRLYMRPLTSWGQHCWDDGRGCRALVGSTKNGPFMILFSCGNPVIVGRPPVPKPENITCTNLGMNVRSGTRLSANSTVSVRGTANGKNLRPGERVDMHYQAFDQSGRLVSTQKANGLAFSGGQVRDSSSRNFKFSSPGRYTIKLTVKYESGRKTASGSGIGACSQQVYIETPPPPPPKVVECSAILMSHRDNQAIVAGDEVSVRGQASGRNLPPGQMVNMRYDYVDQNGNTSGVRKADGVRFDGSIAEDSTERKFILEEPGEYSFRVSVYYDGDKEARGNRVGSCVKKLAVEPPCEGSIDNDITECVILSKKAQNQTQGIEDVNETVAKAGDIIVYTLIAQNTGSRTVEGFVVEENISDILDYADVTDYHGGSIDDGNVVRWPKTDIEAEQSIEKNLTVQIKDPIPQTPASASNPGKFDMTLTNVYGNTVNIHLPPGAVKTTEQVATTLPNTGPGTNIAIAVTITVVAGYFFARSRLLVKELEIVKEEYSSGA